jgi:hypothetical protein
MAARVAPDDYAQVHHFVCASRWPPEPLERVLAERAQALVGGPDAVLIVDDTALLKQGERSVGVGRQYAGAAGKTANCQTLVSLTLARGEVPVGLALRLFLPAEWTDDPARCRAAGVPDDHVAYRTKSDLALDEIDRVTAAGVTYGCVLADAGYGISAYFRQALSARGLTWAVRIPRIQKVYPADVTTAIPAPGVGRPRVHPRPSVASAPAEEVLPAARWRRLTRAPRARSRRASPPCGSSSPTARRTTGSTCPGRPRGSWASGATRARRSSTCRTSRPTPHSGSSRARSRRGGRASRRTSSSRRSWCSTTSRAGRGRACTTTRSCR